jgi:hypothetical protein
MPALALQIVPHTQDHVLLGLRVRLVLRALEILETLPARLRAAERLPVELDVEPLGREVAFLHGDEVVESHPFRRDLHPGERSCHAVSST